MLTARAPGRAVTDKGPHVLAYAVDLNQVRAVDITADACQEYLLCRTEELLDGFDLLQRELNTPSALSKKELPQLERFASEWGRRLLPGSWLSDPPATSILIPNSLLHHLPLHVIRTNSGRPLCVSSAVSVNSSLTGLRRALQRSRPGANYAENFGDPLIEMSKEVFRRAIRRMPARAKEQLSLNIAYTTDERRWLAAGVDTLGSQDDAWRKLPAELLAGFAPNADTAEMSAPAASLRYVVGSQLVKHRYDLIILAAHGYRNPLDALDSGLALRANTGDVYRISINLLGRRADSDGIPYVLQDFPARELPSDLPTSVPAELLSIAELEQKGAHIECPLVVLLGCSTGRPVLYPGDQPVSLAEIFLRIGAAAALAPMWDITVSAAREWMTEFLRTFTSSRSGRADATRSASSARYENGAGLHEVGCMVLHGDYR
jgi:CHAT domain